MQHADRLALQAPLAIAIDPGSKHDRLLCEMAKIGSSKGLAAARPWVRVTDVTAFSWVRILR
jgi:hypothetical protein